MSDVHAHAHADYAVAGPPPWAIPEWCRWSARRSPRQHVPAGVSSLRCAADAGMVAAAGPPCPGDGQAARRRLAGIPECRAGPADAAGLAGLVCGLDRALPWLPRRRYSRLVSSGGDDAVTSSPGSASVHQARVERPNQAGMSPNRLVSAACPSRIAAS